MERVGRGDVAAAAGIVRGGARRSSGPPEDVSRGAPYEPRGQGCGFELPTRQKPPWVQVKHVDAFAEGWNEPARHSTGAAAATPQKLPTGHAIGVSTVPMGQYLRDSRVMWIVRRHELSRAVARVPAGHGFGANVPFVGHKNPPLQGRQSSKLWAPMDGL